MDREIIIIDFNSVDLTHLPFNRALLQIIKSHFKGDSVTYFSCPSHMERMKKVFSGHSELIFLPLSMVKKSIYPLVFFTKYLWFWFGFLWKNKPYHLIITHVGSIELFALYVFKKTLFSDIAVTVILHGELYEAVMPKIGIFKPWRDCFTLGYLLRNIKTPSFDFVVLEESIKKNILHDIPTLKNRVYVLPHPIDLNEDLPSHIVNLIFPKIGFLGIATKAKGFGSFLQFSRKFNSEAGFYAIGMMHQSMATINTTSLIIAPSHLPIERELFEDHVSDLDYICLLYQGGYYDYAASGVLMDAFAFRKPIIALKNNCLDYLQNKYGELGLVVGSLDEMFSIYPKWMSEMTPEKYSDIQNNMIKICEDRSIRKLKQYVDFL